MAVGIDLVLYDDQAFLSLTPDVRWFYVALSLEVLDSGHSGRRLEYTAVLRLAGMTRDESKVAIEKLEDVGLLVRKGDRSINLPKAEIHFKRFGDRNNNLAPNDRKEQVLIVYRHWQNVHGRSQARLTEARRKLIRDRLAEGYTMQNLKDAIEGNKLSAYHQGENEKNRVYDSIDLILRSSDKVEQFMGYKHSSAVAKQARQEQAQEEKRQRQAPAMDRRAKTIAAFKKRTRTVEDPLQPAFGED